MHFHLVLNRGGGTLRRLDVEAFAAAAASTLEAAGHEVTLVIVGGSEISAALDDAVAGPAEVVLVGGGDGTISAAAARLTGTRKTLAILPAGTMNLFARSLGIPLELESAVRSFSSGEIRSVDVGSANGRVFVHQFSVGLHARLIELRENAVFRSKPGKIWASVKAGLGALFRPPRLRVRLEMDDQTIECVTMGVGITNNLFGEGHLPYADMPDEGVLGIYVTRARRKRDLVFFILKLALGRWKANPHVDIYRSEKVTLTNQTERRGFRCAIDGELSNLQPHTRIAILPRALKVLVPGEGKMPL